MKNRKLQRDYSTLVNACKSATETEFAFIKNMNSADEIPAEEFFIMENAMKMVNRNGIQRKSALKTVSNLIEKNTARKLAVEIKIKETNEPEADGLSFVPDPVYRITARCPDCNKIIFAFTYEPKDYPHNYFYGKHPKNGFDIVRFIKEAYQYATSDIQFCPRCGKKFKWKRR